MSYTTLAQSAVDWALSKAGCAYSQAQRTQENIFDCSSLVARATPRSAPLHPNPNPPRGWHRSSCHPLFYRGDRT